MKRPLRWLASISILMISCGGDGQDQKPDSAKMAEEYNEEKLHDKDLEKDMEFAVEAGSGGLTEVVLGQLALTNASSQLVKDFGQNMIDDHSKGNSELLQITDAKGLALPSEPGSEQQKKIRELSEKKGADFDKAYISYVVKDHKEDIELFEKQAERGKDAELKAWAESKIGVLKHHLQMAEQVKEQLK